MSSNGVERFDLMEVYHEGEVECEMRAKPHGEYVRYSDHERIVKELEAHIAERDALSDPPLHY